MTRIVYIGFPSQKITGGQKMILRHVETLRELGFDAVFWTNKSAVLPSWFEHVAPVMVGAPFGEDDILVVPEDAPNALASVGRMKNRSFVLCQNHFYFAIYGFEAVESLGGRGIEGVIACSQAVASSVARSFPNMVLEVIPSFVDEQVFRPFLPQRNAVAYMPGKRPYEARAIRGFFRRYHPEHAGLPWVPIEGLAETAVARHLGQILVVSQSCPLGGFRNGRARSNGLRLCGCGFHGYRW